MSVPFDRAATALALVLGYALLCLLMWWQHRARRRALASATASDVDDDDAVLIAYASQAGFAERLTASGHTDAAASMRMASDLIGRALTLVSLASSSDLTQ